MPVRVGHLAEAIMHLDVSEGDVDAPVQAARWKVFTALDLSRAADIDDGCAMTALTIDERTVTGPWSADERVSLIATSWAFVGGCSNRLSAGS